MINKSQYGKAYKKLPAADYKMAVHLESGRGVYTFCMCPGGRVVASASEDGGVVTNGMSYFARDGKNANSALLVNVTPSDFKTDDPLAGMYFQRGKLSRERLKSAVKIIMHRVKESVTFSERKVTVNIRSSRHTSLM